MAANVWMATSAANGGWRRALKEGGSRTCAKERRRRRVDGAQRIHPVAPVVFTMMTTTDFILGMEHIVGRQRDAGKDDLHAGLFQRGQQLVEIAPRVCDRQAAQAVVAAKLHNHHRRMQFENVLESRQRILGRRAARSPVDDLVPVALGVQFLLQEIGIRLPIGEAASRSDAVAVADDDGPVCEILKNFNIKFLVIKVY